MPVKEAQNLLQQHPNYAQVLNPFLIGDELEGKVESQPQRFALNHEIAKREGENCRFSRRACPALPKMLPHT